MVFIFYNIFSILHYYLANIWKICETAKFSQKKLIEEQNPPMSNLLIIIGN